MHNSFPKHGLRVLDIEASAERVVGNPALTRHPESGRRMLCRFGHRLRTTNNFFKRELVFRRGILDPWKAVTDDSIGATETITPTVDNTRSQPRQKYRRVEKRIPSFSETEDKAEQSDVEKQTSSKKQTKASRKTTIKKPKGDATKTPKENTTEKIQKNKSNTSKASAIEEPQESTIEIEEPQENAIEIENELTEVKALEEATVEPDPLTNDAEPVFEESEALTEPAPVDQALIEDVYVVESIAAAKQAMQKLEEFVDKSRKKQIFACDTEVKDIDVLQDSPCGHGYVTCFSVYAGEDLDFRPEGSSGPPLTHLWVDTFLSGEDKVTETEGIIEVFRSFFENEKYQKVWHNYGFDRHVLKNMDIDCKGFGGDTMHMARLWNSSRKGKGYSLESLSQAKELGLSSESKKTSMKELFGKPKLKKDGSLGKILILPTIVEIQTEEETRARWIQYSTRDVKATYDLYRRLKKRLEDEQESACVMDESVQECYPTIKSLWDFYNAVWRPFGELLTDMEQAGFYVDSDHLAEAQKKAEADKVEAGRRFREWVKEKVPGAEFMNIASDTQIRTLLFAGLENRKNKEKTVELERIIKVLASPANQEPDSETKKRRKVKWEDKKVHGLWGEDQPSPLKPEIYTIAGWPAVSAQALKSLVGKTGVAQEVLKELGDEVQSPNLSDLPVEDDMVSDSLLPNGAEKAFKRLLEANRNGLGSIYTAFEDPRDGLKACVAIEALIETGAIDALLNSFILPLQEDKIKGRDQRIHGSMNINTETGRLSCRRPNLQNQPALEKDRYQIRKAFQADKTADHTLIVADYGQLELRILAHLTNCKSMLEAFRVGGDFHSRTAVGMYDHIQEAIKNHEVALEKGTGEKDIPLVKDVFAIERRKAKILNFSIAYGKTAHGLSKDWKVDLEEAEETLQRWYSDRKEVKVWQERTIIEGRKAGFVTTLLGRRRNLPDLRSSNRSLRSHAERAAINTPIQGSAADIATAAMLAISAHERLKELGWRLLSQVHDEVILEGPRDSAEEAKDIVVKCMSEPFMKNGLACNPLQVELSVDAKCADNWYDAK